MGQHIPLLSQEGWREAPGWFQSGHFQDAYLKIFLEEPPLAL
jgi:hypothetical protein